MNEYFKYYLLDKGNKIINELENVEKCSVSYASLSRLKASASIDMLYDTTININDRIRVVHILNGIKTPIGTFLISTPSQNLDGVTNTVSMDCYSTLWLLDADKCTTRYQVPKGTNIANEIRRIIGDKPHNIKDCDKVTSNNTEWEIGTPYLTIINDLLNMINYTSLYVDANGTYIAEPYILPNDKQIEFEYDEDKDSSIELECVNELDYFDVPNIFVRYNNNLENPIQAKYENNNPDSPTSLINRPPNVNAEEAEATDIQTLYDMCKRACSDATNKYNHITFKTAINPKHLYMNCLYINLHGIREKLIETRWDIECETGGAMTHETRKVVAI